MVVGIKELLKPLGKFKVVLKLSFNEFVYRNKLRGGRGIQWCEEKEERRKRRRWEGLKGVGRGEDHHILHMKQSYLCTVSTVCWGVFSITTYCRAPCTHIMSVVGKSSDTFGQPEDTTLHTVTINRPHIQLLFFVPIAYCSS